MTDQVGGASGDAAPRMTLQPKTLPPRVAAAVNAAMDALSCGDSQDEAWNAACDTYGDDPAPPVSLTPIPAAPVAFGDPTGPAWQRGELHDAKLGERYVEMACCGFRFSADHEDADAPGHYSCPMCAPSPPAPSGSTMSDRQAVDLWIRLGERDASGFANKAELAEYVRTTVRRIVGGSVPGASGWPDVEAAAREVGALAEHLGGESFSFDRMPEDSRYWAERILRAGAISGLRAPGEPT